MEMTFTLGNLFTIGTMIVGIAIAWGTIKTKTLNMDLLLERYRQLCKECQNKVNMEINKISLNQHTVLQKIYALIALIKSIISKQTTAVEVLSTKLLFFIQTLNGKKQGSNNG